VINIPVEYIVKKFYQQVGKPKYNKYNNTYQGSCPICREGASWLKKRRCFYIPKNNNIFCHNCGWSSTPYKWIKETTKLTGAEIKDEIASFDCTPSSSQEDTTSKYQNNEILPLDCINLKDDVQLQYYTDNKIVKAAQEFIKSRNLHIAVNSPRTFYVSLTDYVHKNRLVIPFFDFDRKIVFYQTRLLNVKTHNSAKYISKINSEKSLFNIDQISPDLDKIFIFEGPINACFVPNGIAVAGIQEKSDILYTSKQKEQIDKFPFYDKIWVLDSQWIDKAAYLKTQKLIKANQKVFIWPEKFGKQFKDFNDITIALNQNIINPEFILKNTYQGIKAELMMKMVKNAKV
jgi:hypothetical protein